TEDARVKVACSPGLQRRECRQRRDSLLRNATPLAPILTCGGRWAPSRHGQALRWMTPPWCFAIPVPRKSTLSTGKPRSLVAQLPPFEVAALRPFLMERPQELENESCATL